MGNKHGIPISTSTGHDINIGNHDNNLKISPHGTSGALTLNDHGNKVTIHGSHSNHSKFNSLGVTQQIKTGDDKITMDMTGTNYGPIISGSYDHATGHNDGHITINGSHGPGGNTIGGGYYQDHGNSYWGVGGSHGPGGDQVSVSVGAKW